MSSKISPVTGFRYTFSVTNFYTFTFEKLAGSHVSDIEYHRNKVIGIVSGIARFQT